MRSRIVLCPSCGWSARRAEDLLRPCVRCGNVDLFVAGDPFPLPKDPATLVRALDASPRLLWRVLRDLGDLRLALPWTSDGQEYAERTEMATGRRAAWIQKSPVGGWEWHTLYGQVDCVTTAEALEKADQSLLDGNPTWRLVPTAKVRKAEKETPYEPA